MNELLKQTSLDLIEFLETKSKDSDFPRTQGVPYANRARAVFQTLRPYLHEVQPQNVSRDRGYLTDHGPEHVETVLRRTADLIADASNKPILSNYELYVVAIAACIHDLGNASGRAGHENPPPEVMEKVGPFIGNETVERRMILSIARAHGGKRNGSKDTITNLHREVLVLHHSVRPRLMAAVLRFADELADDSSRASRFLTKTGGVPNESEVYHRYAAALHSVGVIRRDNYVELRFQFNENLARRPHGKGREFVLLLDEIYARTKKMYHELVYCSRFWRSEVPLETIRVSIEVFADDAASDPKVTENYDLSSAGYPDESLPIQDYILSGPLKFPTGQSLIHFLDLLAAPSVQIAGLRVP